MTRGVPAITSTFLKTVRTHRRHQHQCTLVFYLNHIHIIVVTTTNVLSLFTTEMPAECQRLQDCGALLAPKVTRQSNIFLIINCKVFNTFRSFDPSCLCSDVKCVNALQWINVTLLTVNQYCPNCWHFVTD